ncbi:unnamed protein product [Adineta steineri]|uniref:Helicase C-terminal domain-containing protein n=1 Tax=Adineta steineri TaxID=433720 RepID=A0A814T333_9BILA|nr:unnamed protein product [Adineta steineri]
MPTGGTTMDDKGFIYLMDLERQAIWQQDINNNGSWKLIVQDERIIWGDASDVSADGYLYVPMSQNNRIPSFNNGTNQVERPFKIYKIKINSASSIIILNMILFLMNLCKKRKRHDQILCFISSVMEVDQCCRLIDEISRATIVAYPLVQSQHPNVQQENIEHGTVFFSTTVAETSLTFPSFKYVVDTGMINTPIYDIESKRTILKEVRAAQSTIKQRLGRLGRTQSGEYYSVYSFKVDDLLYPNPQICQSDLMNNEFSLRKSPLQKGLDYMKTFLPAKLSQQSIDTTIQQLKQLG